MVWRMLFFGALVSLILLMMGCVAQQVEPLYSDTQGTDIVAYPPPVHVQSTASANLPTGYPSPLPTVVVTSPPLPTDVPTPTTPPMPTPLPTPVVTAVPTLPAGTLGRTAESFWIYYWYEDELWRVDNAGSNSELLLDVDETLGQTLEEITVHPEAPVFSGPRVSISTSGAYIVLVTAESSDDSSYRYSIYAYDVPSREVRSLGPGRLVAWAPDSDRLAYVRDETIQIVDVANGRMVQVADKVTGRVNELSWSADGRYLFYVYDAASAPASSIWLVDVADPAQSRSLLTTDWTVGQLRPRPSSDALLFLSTLGSDDPQYSLTQNLWSLSPATGETRQLTHDLWINRFAVSPDGEWTILQGFPLYVPDEDEPLEQIWLIQLSNGQQFRLPLEQESIRLFGWSPMGGQWLATTSTNEARNLVLIAVDDFSADSTAFPPDSQFLVSPVKE